MTHPAFRALALFLLVPGCAFDGAYAAPSDGGSIGRPPPPGSASDAGAPFAPDASEEEPPEQDRFEDVGTNPFVHTDHDPFSTFAADVDTASYDIFVRDATLGRLPEPASVRLEEYVNAFDYDYPAPAFDAEVPFSIDLVAAQHPFREGIAHRSGWESKPPRPLSSSSCRRIWSSWSTPQAA